MNHIIIVGAGYAGLLAANRLAANHQGSIKVTVINDRPDFVERVRLHELLAGSRDSVSTPLVQMLNPSVELVEDRAVGVAAHEVTLASGERLAADHVVLALGSGGASGPTSLEGALTLRDELAALTAGSLVQVRGAGLTGIEVSAEIADQRTDLRVHLVDPAGLAPGTTAPHRTRLEQSLRRLGVEVATQDARVQVATLTGTVAADRPPDLTVDCTGFRVPSFARDCGLPVDDDDRVVVDRTLAVRGHPGLWATGDCAHVLGMSHLKMGCRSAEPLGGHVADSISATIRGETLPVLELGYAAQCLSLGRRDGMIIPVHPDDTPRAWHLTGRVAALGKRSSAGWRPWLRFGRPGFTAGRKDPSDINE